jgi:hypothetical protein
LFNWLYPLIAGLVLAFYGLLFGAIVGALMGLAMYEMQGVGETFEQQRRCGPSASTSSPT